MKSNLPFDQRVAVVTVSELHAANEDFARPKPVTAEIEPALPPVQGWDPYEVWRTRVKKIPPPAPL